MGKDMFNLMEQQFRGKFMKIILLAAIFLVSTESLIREDVDPEVLFENFEPLEKGGFGQVYKASYKTTSQIVAIKIIDIELEDRSRGKIHREVTALSQFNSPCFPKFYGSYREGSKLWIVMELSTGNSAFDLRVDGPLEVL
jgi:serine/threonine protein kinase